jgi:hypothetical protein
MRLYHGTCTAFESSIKRNGLHPMPQYRYDSKVDSHTEGSKGEHGVYVTPDKETAHMFAQFRADWMRAKIGDIVFYNGLSGREKLSGKVVRSCKPLLVEIDDSVPLHTDENARREDGLYWTDVPIEPQHLTFTVLPDKPNSMIYVVDLDGESLAEIQAAKREDILSE